MDAGGRVGRGFDRMGAQENLRHVFPGVELRLAVAVSGEALRRDAVVPVLGGLLNEWASRMRYAGLRNV